MGVPEVVASLSGLELGSDSSWDPRSSPPGLSHVSQTSSTTTIGSRQGSSPLSRSGGHSSESMHPQNHVIPSEIPQVRYQSLPSPLGSPLVETVNDEKLYDEPYAANSSGSSDAPSVGNSSESSEFAMPVRALGNAKQELHGLYDKILFVARVDIPKQYFVVWDNGHEPHVKKYTCIFVCPATGELFSSGELMRLDNFIYDSAHGTFWYKTKKDAIEAAAARACDCHKYRKHRSRFQHGMEAPYEVGKRPNLPAIPSEKLRLIEDLGGRIG